MKRITLTVIGLMMLATTALAADQTTTGTAAELRGAQQRVALAARGVKGGARQQFELQERNLDRLITDLESGHSVDPKEIDRALKRAETPLW